MIERRQVADVAGLRAAYNATYRRAEYGEREGLYRLVARVLGAGEGEWILDVGCGTGPFGRYMEGRGWGPVVGLDLADEALRKARGRGEGRWVVGQGERLPFGDGAFGRVVCLGNLEHFWDMGEGVRELRRVTAGGGRVVVMLPNAYYSGDVWRVVRTGRGPDHHQAIDRFATCEEWRDVLEGGGLEVEEVLRWDKGKWWKRVFPFHLAYHFVFVCGVGGDAEGGGV